MLLVNFWMDACSLKIFYVFFIIVFFCILNISCSSGKKEIRNEHTNTASTVVLPTAQAKITSKDSILSMESLYVASTENDTLTGVVYVTGNEPFTKLGLQTPDGTMYILKCTKEIESDLRTKQGKIVNIRYNGREHIPEGQALKVVKIEYQNQRTIK